MTGAGRAGRHFEVRGSSIHGRGGFATRPIPRGTRIIEYTGERITHAEADARYDGCARMRASSLRADTASRMRSMWVRKLRTQMRRT